MTDYQYPQIRVSDENLANGETPLDIVKAGVMALQTEGFVVLQNAISIEALDKLQVQMAKDVEAKLKDPFTIFNHGNERTNLSISPPLSKEWLIEEFWANKHAVAVMEAVIGKPQLTLVSSNISLPTENGTRQAVHCDEYNIEHDFPTCLELYMYLEDVSIENGSTEVWPGSHKGWTVNDQCDHGRGWIKQESLKKRAEIQPPVQCFIPKGSVIIRDMRLWHAGMPNLSDKARIMVGFVYFPIWFQNTMRVPLPADCQEIVDSWKHVSVAAKYVNGPVNHLNPSLDLASALNFTSDPTRGVFANRKRFDREQGREKPFIPVTENDYWTAPAPKCSKTTAATKKTACTKKTEKRPASTSGTSSSTGTNAGATSSSGSRSSGLSSKRRRVRVSDTGSPQTIEDAE